MQDTERIKTKKNHGCYVYLDKENRKYKKKDGTISIYHRERWRAEIEHVHPHMFRRTAATLALKRGMPIEQVQQMLGHEDIKTTTIYAQVNTDSVKQSHEKYII